MFTYRKKPKLNTETSWGERDDTIPPKYQHLLMITRRYEGGVQGGAMLQSF